MDLVFINLFLIIIAFLVIIAFSKLDSSILVLVDLF